MTNKPMLSVKRKSYPELHEFDGAEFVRATDYDELRAILDKPEYPRVSIVKAHTHTCACVVGDSGVCDCGAVVDGVAVEVKPAAQNQGEPVGYVSPAGLIGARSGRTAMFRSCEVGVYNIPLFAEQPAPVAPFNDDTVVCRRYQLEQHPGQNFYHYDLEPVYGSVPVTVADLIGAAESEQVAVIAANAFAKGFNTLETGDGKPKIVMEFGNSDEAFDAYMSMSKLATLNGAKP